MHALVKERKKWHIKTHLVWMVNSDRIAKKNLNNLYQWEAHTKISAVCEYRAYTATECAVLFTECDVIVVYICDRRSSSSSSSITLRDSACLCVYLTSMSSAECVLCMHVCEAEDFVFSHQRRASERPCMYWLPEKPTTKPKIRQNIQHTQIDENENKSMRWCWCSSHIRTSTKCQRMSWNLSCRREAAKNRENEEEENEQNATEM